MSAGNFEKCHAITARWEGGWSDHPQDPGGKTMYGITEAVYRAWLHSQGLVAKPVKRITFTEALAIYRSEYWRPSGCEQMGAGVDLAVYDAAVNSGVSRARRWYKASAGGAGYQVVRKLCAKRLSFLQGLRIWKTFGKGWSRRVADIEAKGVAMAVAHVSNKNVARMTVERESVDINRTATAMQKVGAAITALGVTAAGTLKLSPLILLAIGVAALVVVLLFTRSIHHRNRAKAYANEAKAHA